MPRKRTVRVSIPEGLTAAEHSTLQKQFKSSVVGVLKKRTGRDYDPSVENVETTIFRRQSNPKKKKAAAKKSRKSAKK